MPKIAYITREFRPETREVIRTAEAICQEYAAQGFIITLRQLRRRMLTHSSPRQFRVGQALAGDGAHDLVESGAIVAACSTVQR